MKQTANYILYGILFLLVLAIGEIFIKEGSVILADLGNHIMNLFGRASLNPNTTGFSAFIQLLILAIFVGWSINRFKKKK